MEIQPQAPACCAYTTAAPMLLAAPRMGGGLCSRQRRAFLHHVASRFAGGELWFDVCGTMMSRHGVKPDSLRKHEAQIRHGITDGHAVEQWEPSLMLIEQANYMKFFRTRWGFFFGQILGRMTWLCRKFSSMLGYTITSGR